MKKKNERIKLTLCENNLLVIYIKKIIVSDFLMQKIILVQI